MPRLVPAIIDAWRVGERDFAALPEADPSRVDVAKRIQVLQAAHAMAIAEGAARETVVRFLDEHGLSEAIDEAR